MFAEVLQVFSYATRCEHNTFFTEIEEPFQLLYLHGYANMFHGSRNLAVIAINKKTQSLNRDSVAFTWFFGEVLLKFSFFLAVLVCIFRCRLLLSNVRPFVCKIAIDF